MKIEVDIRKEYERNPKVLIQCQERTKEVQEIEALLETKNQKLIGTLNQQEHILHPKAVLYAESVDGVTYLYTKQAVYRTTYSLSELEDRYKMRGYFRCSKSAVLNIHAIESLQSIEGKRIDAALNNGEHIIISRRYAKELRRILKGGNIE